MAVQTITAIADIIKNAYLPAFENQLTTEASPFLEKIKKVPLMSNDIVASAPVGFNGGVGFGGPESAATPDSGPQLYKGFHTQAHDLYCNIEISDKAVKLASNNQGAMMNALDHEIKSAYTAAEFNLGRVLFGNGTGILASITATASAATTIYVSDCVTVREGMIIDAYANASATASGTTPATAGARILAVNREYNTASKGYAVTLDKAVTASTALTSASATAAGTYGFVTLQKSYKREFTGLGAVMDDGVASIYGVTKADNIWVKPTVVDAKNALGDIVLYDGVKRAQDFKNAKIDMILMGDAAFTAYQKYMRSNNTVYVDKTMKFKGGAVGYTVVVGNREVVVVNERFVPTNEAWGVATSDWELHHTTLGFADQGGTDFILVPNYSFYRGLLTLYGDFICKNPGGCVKFINCNAN